MHPQYARSLSEFGVPRELPRSGGWVLERQITGFPYRDAMGCYPLFACSDWAQLHADLDELGKDLVCLSLVTDPFGSYDCSYLQQCFGDLVVPFKAHYVIDLEKPRSKAVSKHHRYYARKALEKVCVEEHPEPARFLDEWTQLHQVLRDKHNIKGIKAFSRKCFEEQLSMPGMVLLRAQAQGVAVAAMMFVVQGDVAYAHVLGCTEDGYESGALYGILWSALDRFEGQARWCDIMGVPGVVDEGAEGIRQFKRGWSQETRMAYLCGRIFDRTKYDEIVSARGISPGSYFPAYRTGEMD
jgi:hypothetical protein